MKNTLLLAFSTICLTQTMLSGCGSFSSKSAKNNGDKGHPIYNVATRYDVKSLDPASVQDWTTAHVLSYLYASIGEVCEIETKDQKTYTLTLKPSKFSNDQPVKPADIQFTLERVLEPETMSGSGFQFASQISPGSIKILSDTQLQFTLTTPDASFKEKLRDRSFGIVNSKLVEKKKQLVTSQLGMGISNWKMIAYTPNSDITLESLIDHQQLKFRYVKDSATRRNLYDTGSVQYAMFAPHELGAIKGHPDISSGGPETLVYLQINPTTQPALDAQTRRIMRLSVQQTVDFNKILAGAVQPVNSMFALSFDDLKQFQPITSKLRMPVPKTEFQITYAEIGMQNPAVESIVTGLNQAGFNVTGRAMPSGEMITRNNKGQIPILFTGWQPDYPGPLNTAPMMFHSKSSGNHTAFKNAEVDKLIDLAQQGIDTEANIRKVTEIIENECPVIPLYIQHDLILKKSDPPQR